MEIYEIKFLKKCTTVIKAPNEEEAMKILTDNAYPVIEKIVSVKKAEHEVKDFINRVDKNNDQKNATDTHQ